MLVFPSSPVATPPLDFPFGAWPLKTPSVTLVSLITLFAAIVLASCARTSSPAGPLQPGIVSLTANPLVANYQIAAPAGSQVMVEFGQTTAYGLTTWWQDTPADGSAANLLVAGMRAAATYHMRALVRFPSGFVQSDVDHTFTTPTLPANLVPQAVVTQLSGSPPAPGIELADLFYVGQNQYRPVAYDLNGNMIWYYDFGAAGAQDSPHPIKLLPNGHMLINVFGGQDAQGFREVDLAGNLIRSLTPQVLNARLAAAGFSLVSEGMHHDFALLPNGHIIALVYEYRTFTDLPGYPGQTLVVGDSLVDLDPNWNPVWTWSTFDHLDVNRHPMSFPDWTHSNAIIYSPEDGNLILSSRHQYWVMKIDYRDGRGTGDILWRLGPGGDFQLLNGDPSQWNYAQHYPKLMSSRSAGVFELGVFDNGNNRVDASGNPCGDPPATPCYSRPVVFQLNEYKKTARIVWEDRLPVFSLCCGNVGLLPNGDFEYDVAIASSSPQSAYVEEVTYTDFPVPVWQMSFPGQLAYRATRIPSLYPGVQW
jgi:arylsulfate sulfotransferase